MAIHHSFTKLLEKMGVDPCADYQEQKVENILIGIQSNIIVGQDNENCFPTH